MKLWHKDTIVENEQSVATERFTVGNDRVWDMYLARYDVLGSLAHARMLSEVGIITPEDFEAIEFGLTEIMASVEAGDFVIEEHVEDVHSQIEMLLTQKIGEAGKKIHTGRSRNDQVLVDLKLFLKHELSNTAALVMQLFNRLQQLSDEHKEQLLPGYTHMQLAMPSSFGLWFGAYAESLVDDMEMLVAAYKIANKNPLGSGAGYGSAFALNRKRTTELLGFDELNYNSVYAQMTRGKTEKAALNAFASVAATLSRFSYDVCLYMTQQFGYLSFPDELTTGSSIMPHKKNPDIFELIRAKCNRLQAAPNEMTMLINNLASGYHRDMQLTKDVLFPAVQTMQDCLKMLLTALRNIQVKENALEGEIFDHLFSVEEINKLVAQGIAFREAYKIVGNAINQNGFNPGRVVMHKHEGSINNLCNPEINEMMQRVYTQIA